MLTAVHLQVAGTAARQQEEAQANSPELDGQYFGQSAPSASQQQEALHHGQQRPRLLQVWSLVKPTSMQEDSPSAVFDLLLGGAGAHTCQCRSSFPFLMGDSRQGSPQRQTERHKHWLQSIPVPRAPLPSRLSSGAIVGGVGLLGVTFVIALFRTVRKYTNPKAKRQRTMNKNKVCLQALLLCCT